MDTPLIYKGQDVMSGTPVFYGTRVPVQTLIDYVTTGDTIEVFLEDFPTVSHEQVVRFLETAGQLMMAHQERNNEFDLRELLCDNEFIEVVSINHE